MLLPYYYSPDMEAGTDEAGRGCLAGPVVAATVILPQTFRSSLVNDSKQLSEKNRKLLRDVIIKEALSWSIGIVEHNEIDQINILNASILAMHKALKKLIPQPKFIIVDGNRFLPYSNIPHKTIVKGDSKYLSIAAASILAKTFRDEIMEKHHLLYPQYAWDKNKGYPTKAHRKGIAENGPSPIHRLSFKLLDTQLKLNLQ